MSNIDITLYNSKLRRYPDYQILGEAKMFYYLWGDSKIIKIKPDGYVDIIFESKELFAGVSFSIVNKFPQIEIAFKDKKVVLDYQSLIRLMIDD